MIIEFFLNILIGFLDLCLSGLGNVISLPVDAIGVLATIWGYGTFILGPDLFVLAMSSIFFWFVTRFTIGLVVFLWKLLPLT